MAADVAREDACREYQSSLEDLTFNSKPHINMLTILAEENLQFAKDIVTLIEAQIAKAPSTEKLPVMYLMDSIVKNVGRDYVAAFAKNVVTTFVIVFEKVDENTRKSLYKLRSTWDDLFPSKKLYALDVRVNQIDPAWPIKPLPPNVNSASIHVNPKFLNKPEESPAPPVSVPEPKSSRPVKVELPKPPLSQEQIIRQQLLIKQKQLLELQQKKLELELEQTKAQLASSISLPVKPSIPEIPQVPIKVPQPTSTSEKNRMPAPPHDKTPASTRDPRLNRGGHSSHSKEGSQHTKDQIPKKEVKTHAQALPDSKTVKPTQSDKSSSSKQEKKSNEKPAKAVATDLKGKAKSPSPSIAKFPHAKDGHLKDSHTKDSKAPAADIAKDSDMSKRDPRLRKHLRDKSDDKPEEIKERRRSTEKKEEHKSSEHRPSGNRNKLVNGVPQKNELSTNDSDKLAPKTGRNLSRKRSRSRSPKSRRERRSPLKRRQRSLSPVSVGPKNIKIRQPGGKPHPENLPASIRDERIKRIPKLELRDNRRPKRPSEERQTESLLSLSTRAGSEPKENMASWQNSKLNKRWRPGWEENKSPQNEDRHQGNRTPYQRRRDSWSNKGILSPRTPKQQQYLSADADLQIPKELINKSKGELLTKANERLTLGEITQDEFLIVAHQIRQLFQYQEEKHRSNSWDSPTEENAARKKPLLSNADLNYYEHKATLKSAPLQPNFMDPGLLDPPMDEMVPGGAEMEQDQRLSIDMAENNDHFPEKACRRSPMLGTRTLEEELIHEARKRREEREALKGLREEPRPLFAERYPLKKSRYDHEQQQGPFADCTDVGNEGLLEDRRPLLDLPVRLPNNEGLLEDRRPLLDLPVRLPNKEGLHEERRPLLDLPGRMPNNEGLHEERRSLLDIPVRLPHNEGLHEERRSLLDLPGRMPNNEGLHEERRSLLDLPGRMPNNEGLHEERRSLLDMPGRMPNNEGLHEERRSLLDLPGRMPNNEGLHEERRSLLDLPGRMPNNEGLHEERRSLLDMPGRMPNNEGLHEERRSLLDLPVRIPNNRGDRLGNKGFEESDIVRENSPAKRFDGPPGNQVVAGQRFENLKGQAVDTHFDTIGNLADPLRFDNISGQPSHLQRFEGGPNQMANNLPIGQRNESPRLSALVPTRFDGPQEQHLGQQIFDNVARQPLGPSQFEGAQPMGPQRFEGGLGQQRFDGPQRFDGGGCAPQNLDEPQRFEGGLGPQRFDGMGPPRFEGSQRFDNSGPQRFDGPQRFEGPIRTPLLQQRFEAPQGPPMRFEQPMAQSVRFDGPGQPLGPVRFEGPYGPRFDGPPGPRFDGPPGPRFDGPPGPRFDGPPGPRFDGPPGPRFDGPPGPRFDGPPGPRFDGPPGPRFDGPPGPRFDGPPGPRFDGPPGSRYEGPAGSRFDGNQGPRFDHGPGPQGMMRFDAPMGQAGPRFDNVPVNQPSLMPRYDVPGQSSTRFDGPRGPHTSRFEGPVHMQPRFDGPMQQRFDAPHQQPRFEIPAGLQGPRFDNANAPIGQNAPPFGQNVPFVDPQNVFHGQSQGMQFQRPDQRFDAPQGPGVTGPGMQGFPNQHPRPSGPFFEEKNPQGAAFGNMPLNPQFPSMGGMSQPAPFNKEPMMGSAAVPNPGLFIPNQPVAPFSNPDNHLGQLDVNELFSKLLSTGIIKPSEPSSSQVTETASQPATEEEEEEEEDEQPEHTDVPDLTGFVLEDLKPRFESVIVRLYTGIQCYSCGMRFTKSQTDVYADHLDWHYRQNRTEKDVSRKITHRRWYYSLTDWIEFEEIAELEERAKSQFFEKVHEEVILKTQEAAKEKEFQSVPAGPAGADEICEICQEQFEQYWDEEEEEWHLKNAMRVNDKIYHPSCYEDYKNTSSFLDTTPSPSKALLENPLSAMLSLVKEEATEPSTVTVKEECKEPSSCGENIPLLTEIKSEPTEPKQELP
ncbi:pre-mRNA cleavage complex 2 protein Pcf11 [Gastrophryne carolinensis]